MRYPRFSLTLFVFLSLVCLPAGHTPTGTGNGQTSIPSLATFSSPTNQFDNLPLGQEPPPDPSAPENEANTTPGNGPRIFLPVVTKTNVSSGSGINIIPNYYVSPSGNDSNPGTSSRPWRTIQKAANTLTAGQAVKILSGTYYEKLTPKNSGSADAYITYTADPGTVTLDGSGISLSNGGLGDGLVQIQGKSYIRVQNLSIRDSSVNCVNISENSNGTSSRYIEILGLNIQNCHTVGVRARHTDHLLLKDNVINHVSYSSGIGVWWSTYATVEHNTITNAHYYHQCQGAYDEALSIVGVNHFEVMRNTLDNTEPNPAGFCSNFEKLGIDVKEYSQNGQVYQNTVRHMNAAGIYVDGWHAGSNGTPSLNHINIYQNRVSDGGGILIGDEQPDGIVEYIYIYNNLVINAYRAGIEVRGVPQDGLRKNIYIYNNTVYGADPVGGNGGAGIYVTTSHLGSNNGDAPVVIRNNISMFYFLYNGGGTLGQIRAASAAIASMVSADHNLVYGPQKCSTEYPNCVEVGNRVSASAASVFVNPGAFDLHLKSSSPAINAGTTLSMVPNDYDSTTRPQPSGNWYDIGAFEYK